MINLRPSAIQILKDESTGVYETEKVKANAFHRVFALNCKPELKPLGPDIHGNNTNRRQRIQREVLKKRTRQKEKVRQYVDVPTAVPPVSRVELTVALRLLHGNKAAGTDRVTNEMLLNLSKQN